MRVSPFAIGLLTVFASLGTDARAQSPSDPVPSAALLSPERDSYATGVITLRAAADADAPIQSVAFYVDGRQVCVLEARPFECDWDAGQEVNAHQVRAIL